MPSTAEKIANHLGCDIEYVKEGRYSPSRWNKPVYTVGENYWCAGFTPAKPQYSYMQLEWEKVTSSYDNKTILWVSTPGMCE